MEIIGPAVTEPVERTSFRDKPAACSAGRHKFPSRPPVRAGFCEMAFRSARTLRETQATDRQGWSVESAIRGSMDECLGERMFADVPCARPGGQGSENMSRWTTRAINRCRRARTREGRDGEMAVRRARRGRAERAFSLPINIVQGASAGCGCVSPRARPPAALLIPRQGL